MSLFCKPAFYAHIFSALFMAAALLTLFRFYKLLRANPYQLIMIFLVTSITLVLHGNSHMKMEKRYGFDPLCQLMTH